VKKLTSITKASINTESNTAADFGHTVNFSN